MLVFFIGLFATVPTSMVAYAFVYRKLAGAGAESQTGETLKNPLYVNLGI